MNEVMISADFEELLSLAIEVKQHNTDEFMIYFRKRVSRLTSKYFRDSTRED